MDYVCTNCGFSLESNRLELACQYCGIFHSYDDFTTCEVCSKSVSDCIYCVSCCQNKCYQCTTFNLRCDGWCGNTLICSSCDIFEHPHFCESCQERKEQISIKNQEILNELRQILNSNNDIRKIKELVERLNNP